MGKSLEQRLATTNTEKGVMFCSIYELCIIPVHDASHRIPLLDHTPTDCDGPVQ